MRASISFSLSADEVPPSQHSILVPPSTNAQLPRVRLSGSNDEDPIPRHPFIKHPLFIYRMYLTASILVIVAFASFFPGGLYQEGIWAAPLYGHFISLLVAIYDLFDYQQTLYFHLRDQVRHGEDNESESLPAWYPKRRFIVADVLLLIYHIGVAIIYFLVVSQSPYYGDRGTPVYIVMVTSIVILFAGISHSICANKEMNARSKMQRYAEEWACACAHCTQVQTIVDANRRRGQHVRAVTVAEPPIATAMDAGASAESDSAMEEGVLIRADLSGYGTITEGPQATQVKKGKTRQTSNDRIKTTGDVTGSPERTTDQGLMDREG